jgi:hypothetical protein
MLSSMLIVGDLFPSVADYAIISFELYDAFGSFIDSE